MTYPSSNPHRSLLLTALGLLVAAAGAVLTALVLRRSRVSGAIQPLSSVPPSALTFPAESPPTEVKIRPVMRMQLSPVRWMVFLVALLAVSVGLVLLQNAEPAVSSAVFILVVLASAGIGIRTYPQEVRQLAVRILHSRQWVRAHRVPLSIASGILGIVLMVQASNAFAIAGRNPWLAEMPFRLMVAGIVALGAAVLLNPPGIPLLERLPTIDSKISRMRWPIAGTGVVCLALVTEINGRLLNILPQDVPYNIQIGLFVLGIVCLMWGLGGDWRWPRITKVELLLLGAITAVAFVLRVVALESSIHRFVDEMNFINAVVRLEAEPTTRILVPFGNVTSFTWVFPYLQGLSVDVLGHTLTAIRFVSSIFGTLTVLALYFLARTLFDRTTALIAAVALATFPAHLHFSRIGLNNIADPFFGTLGLAFVARAWKSNRRSDYALAGAALGLTQYFYEGGRLLFPALAVGWFGLLWLTGRGWRRDWKHVGLTAVVMVMVAAPVYYTTFATQGTVTPRLNSTAISLNDWRKLFASTSAESISRYQRFADPFLTYINLPDMGWFYGGHQALVLASIVPVFLIGVGIIIATLSTGGSLLVLLWVVGTSVGNMLLYENAWTPRYVVALPALALILAVGLRYGLPLIWPGRFRPVLRTILMAALALGLAVGQANYYFNEHLPLFAQEFRGAKDLEDVYFRLPDMPPATQVHIIYLDTVWGFNLNTLIQFWHLNITAEAIYPQQLTVEYLASLSRSSAHAFFVDPEDVGSLDLIRKYFYLLPPRFSPFDVPSNKQLGLYYAPRFTHS